MAAWRNIRAFSGEGAPCDPSYILKMGEGILLTTEYSLRLVLIVDFSIHTSYNEKHKTIYGGAGVWVDSDAVHTAIGIDK